MRLAWIHFVNEGNDYRPDNSLPSGPGFPGGGPVFPGNALPGSGGRPDNSLPPNGSIGTLPVFPFDPTRPDNSLPGEQPEISQPIQLHPGLRLCVKWVACLGFIAVPDNSLPSTPEPK